MAELDPPAAVEAALARIDADGRDGIWIELVPRARALAAAQAVQAKLRDGDVQPLAGRTLAVKANVDVAGLRTTAACPSFGRVAAVSATVVRRLEAAGAVVVGVTNLDQFATGLVGTRSPYGICPNPRWPDLVAGGSSSGSAAAVAAGLVDLGLGTDTAGSGRVPAAANGIVGLKPTRGWLSTAGVVPACQSLDCMSIFATTVDEAWAATLAAAGTDADDPWSRPPGGPAAPRPLRPLRIGVPAPDDLVLGPPFTSADFGRAFEALAGTVAAELVEVRLEPFLEAGRLLYGGGFVAERYAAVGGFVASGPDGLDPTVAAIITGAGSIPAWKLAADRTRLEELRHQTLPVWGAVDVLVLPTVSRLPTPAEVAAEPLAVNTELGRYTTFANLLDLCALTIPVGEARPDHPPLSLSLLAPAWQDGLLQGLGRAATDPVEAPSPSVGQPTA
jgi:allophanate hydrolase